MPDLALPSMSLPRMKADEFLAAPHSTQANSRMTSDMMNKYLLGIMVYNLPQSNCVTALPMKLAQNISTSEKRGFVTHYAELYQPTS